MRERPRPPSSVGEQNSVAHVLYALRRQARVSGGSPPDGVQDLRRMLRDQLVQENPAQSEFIERLLESVDDRDITPELFWAALDMPQYAPTDSNIARSTGCEDV